MNFGELNLLTIKLGEFGTIVKGGRGDRMFCEVSAFLSVMERQRKNCSNNNFIIHIVIHKVNLCVGESNTWKYKLL